jgi:hypothetical protein
MEDIKKDPEIIAPIEEFRQNQHGLTVPPAKPGDIPTLHELKKGDVVLVPKLTQDEPLQAEK